MSMADKQKFKDVCEKVERITATQSRIEKGLKAIKLDEFREKIDSLEKQLDSRCLKSETNDRIVDLMQNLTSARQALKELSSDFDKNSIRTEQRLEDLADKGRGRTQSILHIEKLLKETDEKIMKSRQQAALDSKPQRGKSDDEKPAKDAVTKEVIDEIDEEIKSLHTEMSKLYEMITKLESKQSRNANGQTPNQSSNGLDSGQIRQVEETCMKALGESEEKYNLLQGQLEELQLYVS